ncbi:MAG: DUF4199 domain-containing protein [Bacteroidota bacterium]|nr:DUF4199 domain-containing protein [Bacteroidota bacterium]
MENIKIPLNYGSIAGVVSFAIFLLAYFAGYDPLGAASWLGAWVPIVFIVIGIKKQRDQIFNGYISYGQALGMGLMITFVYASLFGLLVYIFGVLIDPGIVELRKQESLEAMQKGYEQLPQFFSEEYYDTVIEELEQMSVSSIAFSEFTGKLFGGLLISLIAAAFLKHSKSPFEEDNDE